MVDLMDFNASALWGIGAISVLTFFGTLLLLPLLVARIPADYFVRERPRQQDQAPRSLIRFLFLRVLKNVIGLVFIMAGVIMLFTPGQGLLSILVGVILTDFPGKISLGRRIVQQPGVLRAANWMRRKAHQPPLQVPEKMWPGKD